MDGKQKIIAVGVANLKEFGYPNVDSENILTDKIYSAFFRSLLEGNLGDTRLNQEDLKELIAITNAI